MPTRCYLNGVSKRYEANRTLEGFVQWPSEFNFVTRHVFFVLWSPMNGDSLYLQAIVHSKTGVCHQEKQMPSVKTPDIQLCFFLISFQLFKSNAFCANSFRLAFVASPYQVRIWLASRFLSTEIVFERALTDAVVCLNSSVQVKIK